MSFNKHSSELKRLIDEQKKDQLGNREFPETIDPKTPFFFEELTVHQKASFILSLFMPRRDIALAMKIKPKTVNKNIENGLKKLPRDVRKHYERLRSMKSKHANDWLVSASIK